MSECDLSDHETEYHKNRANSVEGSVHHSDQEIASGGTAQSGPLEGAGGAHEQAGQGSMSAAAFNQHYHRREVSRDSRDEQSPLSSDIEDLTTSTILRKTSSFIGAGNDRRRSKSPHLSRSGSFSPDMPVNGSANQHSQVHQDFDNRQQFTSAFTATHDWNNTLQYVIYDEGSRPVSAIEVMPFLILMRLYS